MDEVQGENTADPLLTSLLCPRATNYSHFAIGKSECVYM